MKKIWEAQKHKNFKKYLKISKIVIDFSCKYIQNMEITHSCLHNKNWTM